MRGRPQPEKPPIIIDNGSGVIKIGFGGDTPPCPLVPTIVGKPRQKGKQMDGGMNINRLYIGNEAQRMRGVLNLRYPIENGEIKDWDQMIEIWDYCFSQLGIQTSQHKFLLTEPPRTPNANREKIVETFMERYKAKGVYVATSGTLALYSAGKTTGVVCDSGDCVTHTIPVFEGFSMPHAIGKNFIGGRAITDHIINLLQYDGIKQEGIASSWHQTINLYLKEKLCFVSENSKRDYKQAMKSDDFLVPYYLPDGQLLNINSPRFMGPEALFIPSLIVEGDTTPGIHDMVHNSIQQCDVDIRRELYMSIMLSGGNTLFPGLPERLHKELFKKVNKKCLVMIDDPDDRYYAVWNGGSIVTQLPSFESQWITKQDYLTNGVKMVHRKCII